MKRRAVLIGVTGYSAPEFGPIPAKEDVELLGPAFEKLSFGVEAPQHTWTRNRIHGAISTAIRQADAGEHLVVYVSAHGLHYRGADYIVPTDTELSNPDELDESLVKIDFSTALEASHVENCCIFIDACRQGLDLASVDTKRYVLDEWSAGKRNRAQHRNCNVVFSCGTGEVSRFVQGKYSLFAKALRQTLVDPRVWYWHLGEALQRELDSVTREHDKPRQTVVPRQLGDGTDVSLSWVWSRQPKHVPNDAVFDAIARSYEAIRGHLDYGEARTNALIHQVNAVHRVADTTKVELGQLFRLLSSGDEGDRLVGLVLLERFSYAECYELLRALVQAPRSQFELWHALQASIWMAPLLVWVSRNELGNLCAHIARDSVDSDIKEQANTASLLLKDRQWDADRVASIQHAERGEMPPP